MKRLYVAFFLMALSLAVCIFSSIQIEKNATGIRDGLTQVGEAIRRDETQRAASLLEKVELSWQKTEKLFSFIVDADKIEEMSIGFSMIKAHLKDGNTEHALERLRECDLMLGEISEDEKLSIKNIM